MKQNLEARLEDIQSTTDPAAEANELRTAGSSSEGASAVPSSVLSIPVAIQVVIGSVRLPLSKVIQLGAGSTIPLDQKLGAPVLILVNGKEVARGDLFVLEDQNNRLAITVSEVAGRAASPGN